MGILHDLALLDFAILLKETSDFGLFQARMDACHEEIGSGIDSTIIVFWAAVGFNWRAKVVLASDATDGY
jgi:hypothetical protein